MALDTKDKVYVGIFGLVVLLAGFGGTLLLTPNQLDNAYVCTTNEKVAIFDRLSSTSKTGYYTDLATKEVKSNACTNGVWVKLTKYAEQKGVDVNTFLDKNLEPEKIIPSARSGAKSYSCDVSGCIEKR